MATYADGIGFNYNSAAFPANSTKTHVFKVKLDFAAIAAARTAAGATALASGDVLQVIQLPANSYVHCAGIEVTTAEGATATVGIGDGSSATGYYAAASLNAVASLSSTPALTEGTPNTFTNAYAFGKFYSAADTIDLTLNHNSIDTAVCYVWAVVTHVGNT